MSGAPGAALSGGHKFPRSRDRLEMVGTARFELATPCTPSKCATRLRYVPMESAAQNDDDSVGVDFQILHQSAATVKSHSSQRTR
jgi:hypothetical protein